MGSDLSVVNAARTSFAKESEFEWVERKDSPTVYKQTLSDKDKKLISFLLAHPNLSSTRKILGWLGANLTTKLHQRLVHTTVIPDDSPSAVSNRDEALS